jgi:hypothetical protein
MRCDLLGGFERTAVLQTGCNPGRAKVWQPVE